jgi:hypothetical protein
MVDSGADPAVFGSERTEPSQPSQAGGGPFDEIASAAEAAAARAEAVIHRAESLAVVLGNQLAAPGVDPPPAEDELHGARPAGPVPVEIGLGPILEAGYEKVVLLRLARCGRAQHWPGLTAAAGTAAVAGSWPLLLNLVLMAVSGEHALTTLHANAWVVALAFVNTMMLFTFWRLWWMLHGSCSDLEEMLRNSVTSGPLPAWFSRVMGVWRQVIVPAVLVPLACLLLALAQPAIANRLEIGPVSYVSVAWTAFIGASGCYWLVMLAELGRRMLRVKDLNLVWHSPASTPGIARLSLGYTVGTAGILAVAVGVELLALQVSTYGDSPVLRTISLVLPFAAALAALVFGILPHWWLYLAVRDARRRVLKQLSPLINGPSLSGSRQIAETTERVNLYRLVETSPGLPFSTTSMVEYSAGVLATLIGTLLVIVIGRG